MGSPSISEEKTTKSNTDTFKTKHCKGSLPTVLFLALWVCSVVFCLLVNFKTSHLEYRVLKLETEKTAPQHPDATVLDENGTVPHLQVMIENLVQEVMFYSCLNVLGHMHVFIIQEQ